MRKVGISAFVGGLFLVSTAFAQTGGSMNTKPTIVFVHGLWADGSSWSKVINPLVDTGYKVISVQNPTTSLEDDVAATKRGIDRADGDVILVGHSWGGSVITEAGADPRVKALVYIAAFAPDKGETARSLSESVAPTPLPGFIQNANGYLTVSREGVAKAFAGDLKPKEQDVVTPFSHPLPKEYSVMSASMPHEELNHRGTWSLPKTKPLILSWKKQWQKEPMQKRRS
jgi:pimeloyl-ACP methyl ester carboxylesterase